MKKIYSALPVALMLVSSSAFASTNLIEFKAGYVLNDNNNKDSRDWNIDEVMTYGASFTRMSEQGTGVETEIMVHQDADIALKEGSSASVGQVSTIKLGSYVSYYLPVTQNVDVKLKGGYVQYFRSFDSKSNGYTFGMGNTSGYTFGGGLAMKLSPQVRLTSEYNYTLADGKGSDVTVGIQLGM